MILLCLLAVLLPLAAGCGGPFPQSAMSPASDVAARLDGLFMGILWWAVGVFVLVEGALLVAIFRFRARGKDASDERGEPRQVHGNTLLELAWTLAPALVLVVIAVPTMTTIWDIDRPTTDPNALQIIVTGHQWWWEFEYPEYELVTANEPHIPVGRAIDLRLHSADVIHSFWFPRVAGKRDVIPGHENQLWFTADSVGRYTGQCAEFCGTSHALMKMELVVDSEADFAAWVEAQTRPSPALRAVAGAQGAAAQVDTGPAAAAAAARAAAAPDTAAEQAPAEQEVPALAGMELAEIMTRGQQLLLTKGCIACHRIEGTPAQGVLGPDLSHVGSRRTIAAGILENTQENRVRWIDNPVAVKPDALMPDLQLNEEELQIIAAYLGKLK